TKNALIFVSKYGGILITDSTFRKRQIVSPQVDMTEREQLIINNAFFGPGHSFLIATSEGVFTIDSKNYQLQRATGLLAHLTKINIVDALFLSPNKVLVASENSGLYFIRKDTAANIVTSNY